MCVCHRMCEQATLTLRSSLKSSAAVVKWGTAFLQCGHPGRGEHTDGTLLQPIITHLHRNVKLHVLNSTLYRKSSHINMMLLTCTHSRLQTK